MAVKARWKSDQSGSAIRLATALRGESDSPHASLPSGTAPSGPIWETRQREIRLPMDACRLTSGRRDSLFLEQDGRWGREAARGGRGGLWAAVVGLSTTQAART